MPDSDQRLVPNEQFAQLMTAVLDQGKPIRFNAKGVSMSPFIKDGDTVTIAPIGRRRPVLGDVLAFNHPERGELLVHRVVARKADRYLMKADHGRHPDGWISPGDVIGLLAAVQRGEQRVWLGLGCEKWLIAQLSRQDLLMPAVRFLWRLTPAFLKAKLR
jgi:hypothetical protein